MYYILNSLLYEDKKPYIKMLTLLPEYRFQGIGQYVVKLIKDELKNRGYLSLKLVTDKENKHAIHCYEKCGFVVTRNNIIINSEKAISYDNRGREGVVNDGWFDHSRKEINGGLYEILLASPWQSKIWQKAFSQYKTMTLDYSNPDDPNLPFNPAGSIVSENIIVSMSARSIGNIHDDIYRFSG